MGYMLLPNNNPPGQKHDSKTYMNADSSTCDINATIQLQFLNQTLRQQLSTWFGLTQLEVEDPETFQTLIKAKLFQEYDTETTDTESATYSLEDIIQRKISFLRGKTFLRLDYKKRKGKQWASFDEIYEQNFKYVKFLKSDLLDLSRTVSFISQSDFEGIQTNFLHIVDQTDHVRQRQKDSASTLPKQ